MLPRKLGLTETYSKFCHDYANGTTLLSGIVQVEGPLTLSIIENALSLIQNRHEILRSYFSESTEKTDYLDVDKKSEYLPLTVVNRESDRLWEDEMEKCSMRMFSNEDRYLWRTVFIHNEEDINGAHEIIVTFMHSISDGISIGLFFKELFHYCKLLTDKNQIDIKELKIIPPVEELLIKKVSWPGFLTKMIGSTFKYIKLYKHLDRYENVVPLKHRKHRNCYREINENLTKALIQKCHENNSTITSLLTAALSKATHFVISQDGKYLTKQLVLTPVSVRPRCEPAIEDGRIGCFVDFIESTLCFENDTSLWEISKSFRNQILSGIKQGGHTPVKFSKPFTIKIFSNLEKGMFKNIFHYGIGVTNIGRVDLPEKLGPFYIRQFNLSTGRQWGDWLTLLHVASIENRMFLCFCYAEPLVSEKTINNIADNMMSLLFWCCIEDI